MPSQIKDFLDLVKQTRLKNGLPHQQLADKAGINRSTISLMESHQLVS
ncbi:helix-turn-helix domain-containing protein [bacterium]|nr:helix-turn-helix domain-containing protein [bacterium]